MIDIVPKLFKLAPRATLSAAGKVLQVDNLLKQWTFDQAREAEPDNAVAHYGW